MPDTLATNNAARADYYKTGSYHIWHPSWIDNTQTTLECFLTLGEAFRLGRGDDQVVAAVLKALGIDATPVRWEIAVGRSHYFTSYYEDATEWQDKWSLAWRLRCDLPHPTQLPDIPKWGFFDVEFVDSSFKSDHDPENDDAWRCFVVADFRARPSDATLASYGTVTWGSAYGLYPQLHLDLGDRSRDWFSAGATAAEQVLAKLRSAGASTRFHETQRWYAADHGGARPGAARS